MVQPAPTSSRGFLPRELNILYAYVLSIKVIDRLTVSSMKISEVQFMKTSDLLVQSIKPNTNYKSPAA